MATEPLFADLYQEVSKKSKDYCSVCFRTSKERRLLDGKNLIKFKLFRLYNHLEYTGNIDKFCDQKICYICNAQAMAANRFCLAVNLSQHIHALFAKMAKIPSFAMQVIGHLRNVGTPQPELLHNDKNVETLQTMLEQLRRNTTLMQTDTLLLNNPEKECIVETLSTPAVSHESLRDLLTFESQPDIDEALFDLDASQINNKQIIIEDDDPIIKEEPPDQNVFIIPDRLPSAAPPVSTDTLTHNTTGYLLHPILMNNGTITIPSLDKNISIKRPNPTANGAPKNTNQSIALLDKFIVTPLPQLVPTNSNQNKPNLNFIRNTNSLAKNIVSMVKNANSTQNKRNFAQNTSNLNQNTSNLSQNTVVLEKNTGNCVQKNTSNLGQQSIQTSAAMPNLHNVTPKPIPVKVTASPVKRSDSDSDANCQNIQPIRKPDGKIDWEDKIPMDVISFVSPSDPTTAKRQKVTNVSGLVTSMRHVDNELHTPMGVITEVKSVKEPEVIDLC